MNRALVHRVLSSTLNLQTLMKVKAAILQFDDVTTVSCALCNLIAHLTFQMRKVSVTRNSSQTTRRSPPGGVDSWAQD